MPSISNSILFVSSLRQAITFPINNIFYLLLVIFLVLYLHLCLFLTFWMLGFGIGGIELLLI